MTIITAEMFLSLSILNSARQISGILSHYIQKLCLLLQVNKQKTISSYPLITDLFLFFPSIFDFETFLPPIHYLK